MSFALKAPKNDIENPLNSLTNADILLRSSGSSQSSLQSLRDDNRVLESVPGSPKKVNPGLSLNDGIKGFSDEVVESLLPRDLSRDKLETTKEMMHQNTTMRILLMLNRLIPIRDNS